MSNPPALKHGQLAAMRFRITFATAYALAYVSVLELGTIWERTLRRARLPLRYSMGFNPRPRMHFAAPLPVGCGSERDLLDLWLTEPRTADQIAQAVAGVLPPHLTVVSVDPVDEQTPALSERLTAADYRVQVFGGSPEAIANAVTELMQAESWMMARRGRRHSGQIYDLRGLVLSLNAESNPHDLSTTLTMRLKAQPGATGRPDEVLKALGLADLPRRCVRTGLILTENDHHSPPSRSTARADQSMHASH